MEKKRWLGLSGSVALARVFWIVRSRIWSAKGRDALAMCLGKSGWVNLALVHPLVEQILVDYTHLVAVPLQKLQTYLWSYH
jgi:hypothetical protein